MTLATVGHRARTRTQVVALVREPAVAKEANSMKRERRTGDIVLLPREHDLRCAVVPRRDVTRHLRVCEPGQAKVADLEVAVLVDEDVGRFQIPVDDARRVNVFQAALEEER